MWLINVESRQLECFNDERSLPLYAILSHTWSTSEVTMEQYREAVADKSDESTQIKNTQGYLKIEASCLQASADNLPYIWIDTCCIDKTSSAELSEAINSMFRWYQIARVCYVLLDDVEATYSDQDRLEGAVRAVGYSSLCKARWFTRGWTLQELVAPRHMDFFDKNWTCFGTKATLKSTLARITGIDEPYLVGAALRKASIAKRMSWAARRVTTKVEDLAYSLFGIFDVNMPLLYGEGMKAFVRLQEEILKDNDDHSLFAWQPSEAVELNWSSLRLTSSMLTKDGISVFAQHPRCFLVSSRASAYTSEGEAAVVGGKGLKVTLPLFKIVGAENSMLRVAVLNCSGVPLSGDRPGIILQKLASGHYLRHPNAALVHMNASKVQWDDYQSIYIRKKASATVPTRSTLEKARGAARKIDVWWGTAKS